VLLPVCWYRVAGLPIAQVKGYVLYLLGRVAIGRRPARDHCHTPAGERAEVFHGSAACCTRAGPTPRQGLGRNTSVGAASTECGGRTVYVARVTYYKRRALIC
jgi:hypothetical protein